jgi:hypothetical protein
MNTKILFRNSLLKINYSDNSIITENNINQIILYYIENNREYFFDFGSFCYKEYKKQPIKNIIQEDKQDKSRNIYIKNLIIAILSLNTQPSILKILYLEFHYFISFYNKYFSNSDFNESNLKMAFLEYCSISKDYKSLSLKQYIISYFLSVVLDQYFEDFSHLVEIDYSNLRTPLQLQSKCKSIFNYRNVNIIDLKYCNSYLKNIPIENYVFITTLGNKIQYEMDLGSLLYLRRYPHPNLLKNNELFQGNKVDLSSIILERKPALEKFKDAFINLKLSDKLKLQLFRVVKKFLDYTDNQSKSPCNLSNSLDLIFFFKKYLSIQYSSTLQTRHKDENIKFLCYFISICSNYDIKKLFTIAELPFNEKRIFSQLFLTTENTFTKRSTNIINLSTLTSHDNFSDISEIILLFKDKNKTGYFDLGSYCYSERIFSSQTKADINYRGNAINKSTLIIERKISLEKFLVSLCSYSSNINTLWTLLNHLKYFLNFLDDNFKYCTFNNLSEMKNIYQEFTSHLIHRMRVSPINARAIKPKSASNHQSVARFFIASCLDLEESDVLNYAPFIKQNQMDVTEPVNQNILQENFKYNKIIFESIYQFLFNNSPFPLKIEFDKSHSLTLYSKNIQAYKPTDDLTINCIRQEHFLSYTELVEFLKNHNTSNYILSRYNETLKYYNESNSEFHRERIYLTNIACHAFLNLFFAETGVNLETALSIKLSNIDLASSRKGFRSLVSTKFNLNNSDSININNIIKKRAYNKSLDIEISLKFKPLFIMFLNLRDWLCQTKFSNDYLFVYPTIKDRAHSTYDLESISGTSLRRYKVWLNQNVPECNWITPTEYRKTKARLVSQLSDGDIEITAKILGNSINTIKRYYSDYNTDDYLSDMDKAITELRNLAIEKAGFNSFESPQILEYQSNHLETIAGHCNNQATEPTPLSGSTLITPIPDCKQKQNCLFCQHFLIHANEHDIAKLLTQKWWLTENKVLNDLNVQLSLQRIENFLEALIQSDIKFKLLIETIQSEIEIGKYPNFWDRRLQIIYSVHEEI